MGALTVARMREVEAEAGLTPASKAESADNNATDGSLDAADAEFLQPPQAPAPQEVRLAADQVVRLLSVQRLLSRVNAGRAHLRVQGTC